MDDQLLAKYLSGEATPEEAILVEEWLSIPGNMEQFRQSAAVWAQLAGDPLHRLPEQNSTWQKIRPALQQRQNSRPRAHNSWWKYSIAASILAILLAGSWFLFFRTSPNQEGDYMAREYVQRTATGQVLRDTLPDGSLVVLNSFSRIQYAKDFPAGGRILGLTGEAWFDVAPDPARIFRVNAGPVAIKVLGTRFNVRTTPDSVLVALESGSVRMCAGSDSITLQPGQTGIYDIRNRRFGLAPFDDINQTGYATRNFDFKNASLQSIAAQIEKAYDIRIVFSNKALEKCTMSSTFNNESLDYILNVIAVTLNIQFRTENKTVYLSGNSCE